MSKISVVFIHGWDNYNAGERAGFKPNVANKLIDSGLAKEIKEKKEEVQVEVNKPAPNPTKKPLEKTEVVEKNHEAKELPYFASLRAMNDLLEERGLEKPDSRDKETVATTLKELVDNPYEYLETHGYLE